MIVLKILLFILLAVLGLILLVLIMPVGGEMSFIGGKLKYKVNLWFINVMDSDGGGILGWLKKRKSKKKKSGKPKSKKIRSKKKKEKKSPEQPPVQISAPDGTASAAEETADKPEEEPAAVSSSTLKSDEPVLGTDLSENDENDYDIPGEDSGESDDKSEKKKKKSKDDPDDDGGDEKKPLSDKIDKLIDIWGSARNPLCLIFKAFKFSDLYIDFVIANEDACKCALNYGRLSAVTYRGLALLSRIFTVRLKTVDVQPGFGMKKGKFDAAFRLRFRVGTFVIAGLWFLITYIFRVFIPGKLRSRKEKKSAAVQK